MRLMIVRVVLALAAGFGAGWIVHDATHSTTRIVVQGSSGNRCRQYDILDPTRCIKR